MLSNGKVLMKLGLFCLAVAILAAVGVSSAHAGDQDFVLVNKTGIEIHKVYISPHSSDEWGEDILGKDTLDDGEYVTITFPKKTKSAHWDLKVVDGHGGSVTWEELNLLEISKVTLHYKDGKAWADTE